MSTIPLPKRMSVKEALLCTFAYFDLMKRPLAREEITEFFLFEDPDENKIDLYLKESPLVVQRDGLFALSEEVIQQHLQQKKRIQSYWKTVMRWRWLFQICPFVKLVCVCNSLPLSHIEEDSDIDLFVVAEKGRLFLARMSLTILLALFGVRRHGKKVKKRFCLSFYISEEAANLQPILQEPYDIYLAYWVKTIQPIAGDYESYEQFMRTNEAWLSPYFSSFTRNKRYFRTASKWQTWLKNKLQAFGTARREERAKAYQLRRIREKVKMLPDPSGTVVSDVMLKFHDRDARAKIRKAWVGRVNELL